MPERTTPRTDNDATREALWEAIAAIRDGAARVHDDADTWDIVDAVMPALARAWDEGAAKASPHGGGYLRSLLIENPYRDFPPVSGGDSDAERSSHGFEDDAEGDLYVHLVRDHGLVDIPQDADLERHHRAVHNPTLSRASEGTSNE